MNLFPMRIDGPSILVSVTDTASTPAALAYAARAVRITNTGTDVAYVAVRPDATNPTGTASQNSTAVGAGSDVTFTMQYDSTPNYVSAICGTGDSTTLVVQIGEGI